jgi:2-oxoisovalerate dehydrogenase E1 component alpha subunit
MSDRKKLKLHIPEPAARPGQPGGEFQHLSIPDAGTVRRPDTGTAESKLRDLPFELIRVLDDNGSALGEWCPDLTPDVLRRGLRAMTMTRLFDDQMFRLQRQGKTSFYMKSSGEEATAVAPSLMLQPDDMCFPTARLVGWLMARDYPVIKLVNQIFSNAKDPLKGRQLPVLYSARDYGFYSLSGNVGSRYGHAVGWAMASAYKNDSRISISYTGEGSTAEGDFHEAMTFASVFRAPVILCVTNNQWAISSFAGIAGADETTFAAKAIAYGIPGLRVDGNDFLAVWSATEWAAERARANHGPTLIEFFTYRAEGHSTSDDPSRYRPADEAGRWPLGDPVERLKQHLIRVDEWSEAQHETMCDEIVAALRAAVKEGQATGTLGESKPDVSTMFDDVFKERDWRADEQDREFGD